MDITSGKCWVSTEASERIWRAWDWQGKAERDGLTRNIFSESPAQWTPTDPVTSGKLSPSHCLRGQSWPQGQELTPC